MDKEVEKMMVKKLFTPVESHRFFSVSACKEKGWEMADSSRFQKIK